MLHDIDLLRHLCWNVPEVRPVQRENVTDSEAVKSFRRTFRELQVVAMLRFERPAPCVAPLLMFIRVFWAWRHILRSDVRIAAEAIFASQVVWLVRDESARGVCR
ncbi:hypothetical protein SAMN04488040_1155 [Sulfitobacter marinus]|uniref:Uncharacterized protein n=1 Tax=Sulfitobacter marinus TaxID=394264 RepID=A0A1I6QZX1_9RHOB|nr:hypothetical protein SAMN04488040_1155 [Sulfitobacter marinus]